MYLSIFSDGSVSYLRYKNGGETLITASIKKFVVDNFVVGFAFFTTNFDVTAPPQRLNGNWIMIVDGVTLTKYNN